MSSTQGRKRATLTIAAVIVLGVFGYLMFSGMEDNVVFFWTPQELLAKGNKGYDVPVRLGGMVSPGSVKWDADRLDLRFVVNDGKGSITVHSRGAPPQMFRDGMGIVVEGRYHRDGVFESSNLMVKHSNEYRAPKNGERPKEMYKTLMEGAKS
jgi:cytochrome c-type biogenesis protein CcmE